MKLSNIQSSIRNKASICFCLFGMLLFLSCGKTESRELPVDAAGLENLTIHPVAPEPLKELNLEQEMVYLENEEVLWGRVLIDMDTDAEGRLYIADIMQGSVHVYNDEGSYLRSIGRRGEGPGEFTEMWGLQVSGDILHVFDANTSRVSLFDVDTGQHIRDILIEPGAADDGLPDWQTAEQTPDFPYRTERIYVVPDNRYMILFKPLPGMLMDNEGQTVEISLFDSSEEKFAAHDVLSLRADGTALHFDESDGGGGWGDAIFNPRARIDYGSETLVYGWDEEMLFSVYDHDAAYRFSFWHPHQNAPMTTDDLLRVYQNPDETISQILETYAPDAWPAYDHLIVDDENRLWVSVITQDLSQREWRVMDLNNSGALLSVIELDQDINVQHIRGEKLYTMEQNSETGERRIVRYRIEMEE